MMLPLNANLSSQECTYVYIQAKRFGFTAIIYKWVYKLLLGTQWWWQIFATGPQIRPPISLCVVSSWAHGSFNLSSLFAFHALFIVRVNNVVPIRQWLPQHPIYYFRNEGRFPRVVISRDSNVSTGPDRGATLELSPKAFQGMLALMHAFPKRNPLKSIVDSSQYNKQCVFIGMNVQTITILWTGLNIKTNGCSSTYFN